MREFPALNHWNLADAAQYIVGTPVFAKPLAEALPGTSSTPSVDPARYTVTYIAEPVAVQVAIADIDGFPDDQGGLPSPSIRLHAVAPGQLYVDFSNPEEPRLVLETARFALSTETSVAPWWEMWTEADTIPELVIYESIDFGATETLVNGLRSNAETSFGLHLPPDVSSAGASDYIDAFLTGGAVLNVDPFAVIGAAGPLAAGGSTDRMVSFKAEYSRGRSMHFGELLNLLFWDEAHDSTLQQADVPPYSHPLLAALQTTVTTQLRPPLRTFKRLRWEATYEEVHHKANWSADGALKDAAGAAIMTNPSVSASAASFYDGLFKCNLLVGELSFRSGFRCLVRQGFYLLANALTECGWAEPTAIDGEVAARNWGLKRGPSLRAALATSQTKLTATDPTIDDLNRRIADLGRVMFIGIRRSMVDLPNPPRPGHVGILVRIDELGADLTDADGDGDTEEIGDLVATVIEAATNGAQDGTWRLVRLRRGSMHYDEVSVVELLPGGDPQTAWGCADLTIRI